MLMIIENKLFRATFYVEHNGKKYNVTYSEEATLKEKVIVIRELDEDRFLHTDEVSQTPGTIGAEIVEAVSDKIALCRKDWL